MSLQTANINRMNLKQFKVFFSSLAIPDPTYLPGIYRGIFVGPGWLRAWAGPALVMTGLGGWWGKKFYADGRVNNIVLRAGEFDKVFPMRLAQGKSLIDRQDALMLRYLPENPFPWPLVLDEIRRLDDDSMLGVSIANIRGLRGLALPFVLLKSKDGLLQDKLITQPLPRAGL